MKAPKSKKVKTTKSRKKETSSGQKTTRREKVCEKLLGSKEIYQYLIQNSGNVIICLSPDHRIIEWNREAERTYGWKREKVLGKDYFELFIPEDVRNDVAADMNKVMKGELTGGFESKVFAHDRKERILNWYVDCIFDTKGKPCGVIAFGQDITERKQAEEALKESERKYRDLVDNALVGVYKTNLKGDIIYVNKALSNIFEYESPEEIMLVGVISRYKNPKDREILIENLKRTGKVNNFEIETLTKTGKTKNVLLSATLEGDVISGMVLDITERRQIRESITKAKVEWEMTFDSAMELIMLVDKELNIIRCNKSFAEFAGVPIKEIIGHNYYEYLSPSDPEQFEHCKELMDREEPVPRTEINTKTGHWFYISSCPILDEKGKFLHTVITATDITELKKAQQRLEESEKKLKKRIEQLEKFYEMAVGRELKMKELKKEIKELEFGLSQYKKDDGNER